MELSAKNATLTAAKSAAEQELSDHRAAQANALVDMAVKEGRITADNKESFVKLATSDFKQAQDLIGSIPAKETFADKTGKRLEVDRMGWDYMKWLKEDSKGLSAMREDDPDRFAQLKANYQPKY